MTAPGMPIHFVDAPCRTVGDVTTYLPHADRDGSGLELAVVSVRSAPVSREVPAGRDEVLYVLSGSAELESEALSQAIGPHTAAHVPGDTAYRLSGDGHVAVVSGRAGARGRRRSVSCLDLAGQSRHAAVSDREFQLLFGPDQGCGGMTQFVGYVPQVRTPRHIHPYSEMLCIVSGQGLVEIDGDEHQVGPGFCYYLPAGTPHLVQNCGKELLVELGVFTPAGSPAQNTPVE